MNACILKITKFSLNKTLNLWFGYVAVDSKLPVDGR